MNLALRMRKKIVLFFAINLSLATLVACHPAGDAPTAENDLSPPATTPVCQYVVSGGVAHPGPRTLQSGDTVSTVLARDFPPPAARPCTIVLIRQAPEGKTRTLVQLDATGKLVNEKQDWSLRNGDEIVFPGGNGSNADRNPTGPPPRTTD